MHAPAATRRPSQPEALQARYADTWDIWRELLPDGMHGDWVAQTRPDPPEQTLRSATIEGLEAHLLAAGRVADIRAEFPGWTIQTHDGDGDGGELLWRAFRDPDETNSPALAAGSYGGLRRLLDQADAADARQAVLALRDALRARGLPAEVQIRTLVTRTRTGIPCMVHARRGHYAWTSGDELGAFGDDPAAVAQRMLPGLDLA